jgi:hypothetical protein
VLLRAACSPIDLREVSIGSTEISLSTDLTALCETTLSMLLDPITQPPRSSRSRNRRGRPTELALDPCSQPRLIEVSEQLLDVIDPTEPQL